LTCIVINTSCGQNKSQNHLEKKDTSQQATLNVDTSEIAIFNLKADLWLRKRFGTAKSFRLTNTDLKTIIELYKKCVHENNIDTSHFHYRRQYVPFIDTDGHRKVWINCFCSDFNFSYPFWKKSIVLVDDGGSCFFNVVINLTDNSFTNFEVNGNG
jgi:hypothetical protein